MGPLRYVLRGITLETMAKRDAPMLVTPIRLPRLLLRRLDAYAKQLRDEQPGVQITRSDAIRLLLERGLDTMSKRKR